MNIPTSNGMGLKSTGMQLKPSNGIGIKTGNGMGIPRSNGMGMSSDKNYFKFNEYLFGDRGKGNNWKKPAPKSALKKIPTEKSKGTPKPAGKHKSVTLVTSIPEASTPLPSLTGNSLGSTKRMLKMFG